MLVRSLLILKIATSGRLLLTKARRRRRVRPCTLELGFL